MAHYLTPPTEDRHDDFGDDRCVALIRKAGSTSMERVLTPGWIYTEAPTCSLRVAFIREPLTRLVSAYSFLKELHRRNTQMGPEAPPKSAFSDWRSFVDFALENYNQHWCSQVDHLTNDGVYVPTNTHRFEDIGTLWQEYFNTNLLPTYNSCVHQKVDDYRIDDIKDFYTKDLELWHSL